MGMSNAWSEPGMVAGFARSGPNQELIRFAHAERVRVAHGLAIDIGCGAARNLLPLAQQGWRAIGVDASAPMLTAAAERLRADAPAARVALAVARMDALSVRDRAADLIVAHGIWNLARSSDEFRRAVREAARVAKPGAALFVFTFSRHTLPASAAPVAGEPFVFTQFAGDPQCFLTEAQLIHEMRAAGFEPDAAVPLREHNRPAAGRIGMGGGPPVIYEAAFRFGAP
jgi:ubiquinone/menaquinone biosynthesis C-methylase UbiE